MMRTFFCASINRGDIVAGSAANGKWKIGQSAKMNHATAPICLWSHSASHGACEKVYFSLTADIRLCRISESMRTKCRHRWNEKQLNIRVSPEFDQRIKRVAAEKGMTKREFVEWAVWQQVQNAKLKNTDYEEIAKEIRKIAKRLGVPEHEALSDYADVTKKIRRQ